MVSLACLKQDPERGFRSGTRVELNFLKNRQFQYENCTLDFATILNKKQIDKIIGKTDFDLGWRDTCASVCRAEDELVVSSKKIITDRVEFVVGHPDAQDDYRYAHLVVGFRKPIVANNEVIAITGSYRTVADMRNSEIEAYWKANEKRRYYLCNNNIEYLTKSEAKLLFYYINMPESYNISELGTYLGLTKATIYSYLRNIKEKLAVTGRKSLFEKLHKSCFYDHFTL